MMIAQLRRFALPVIALCALALPAAPARAGPLVFVDGRYVNTPAVVVRGRTFLSARDVARRLNAVVLTPSARELTLVRDGRVAARARIGTRAAVVHGRPVLLDGAPFRRGTRTFVPSELLRDALGVRIARTSRPAAIRLDRPRAPVPAPRGIPARTAAFVPVLPADPGRSFTDLIWVWAGLGLLVVALLLQTVWRMSPWGARARVVTEPLIGRNTPSARDVPQPVPPRSARHQPHPRRPVPDVRGDGSIALRAQELAVDKTLLDRGEARVHIEVVTEERTVTVPLKRERLVIEYTGQSGAVTIDGVPLKPGEIVRIPLREEHVEITKHTVVSEDVVIGKHAIEEQQLFHETLQHEELVEEPSDGRTASLGTT